MPCPSKSSRSLGVLLPPPLSCSLFSLRRVSSCPPPPPRFVLSPCHLVTDQISRTTPCEKGNEKGVRACRERGLNARRTDVCIYVTIGPQESGPLYFLLAAYHRFFLLFYYLHNDARSSAPSKSARLPRWPPATGSALKYNNLFSRVMEKRGTNFTVNRRTSRAISANLQIIVLLLQLVLPPSLPLSLSLSESTSATRTARALRLLD